MSRVLFRSALIRAACRFVASVELAGCARSEVAPDLVADAPTEFAVEAAPTSCGDGNLDTGEECDLSSPGCVGCKVLSGWTCTDSECTPPCGDGVTGDGATCANPRKSEPCDMTGWWAARETTFERDTVVGSVQTSSTWYLYRFSQAAGVFQVEEQLHCGIHVHGAVTVEPKPAAQRRLFAQARMDATSKHGPRKGSFAASGPGCGFTLARWYAVRGIGDEFLPADFAAKPTLASLPGVPTESDPVHPTRTNVAGAIDFDGDGSLGIGFTLSGLASGVRHAAQRDFTEFATSAPIAERAVRFVVPGTFELNESVLSVTECGDSCALLATKAFVAPELTPRLTLYFLGNTITSARVAALIKGKPHESDDDDEATCANVRAFLPFEEAAK